jgi:hypothetical protein
MITAEIQRHLDGNPRKYSGTHAIFVPISDRWGAKLFYTANQRDASRASNEELYSLGLAPAYGPTFKVECLDPNGYLQTFYGYLMEVVECCDQAALEYHDVIDSWTGICKHQNDLDYFFYCNEGGYWEFLDQDVRWGIAHEELNEKIEAANLYYTDTHAGNWGITHDGRSVLIDFDKTCYIKESSSD